MFGVKTLGTPNFFTPYRSNGDRGLLPKSEFHGLKWRVRELAKPRLFQKALLPKCESLHKSGTYKSHKAEDWKYPKSAWFQSIVTVFLNSESDQEEASQGFP